MAELFVDDSGNGDFLTIAEAIAVAKRDDKIIVTGGEDNLHKEANITIDKRVTIQSDSDGATIDAQGQDFIADFMDGQDFLGLSDGLTYEDLTFSGQTINFGDQTLAVLTGVDTTTLTSQDFIVM